MVCINSKKLAGLEFGRTVETRVKIEETAPLHPVTVRGRTATDIHRSGWRRLMRGTAIIILFLILASLFTLLRDSHHSVLAEEKRISHFHNWFINSVSNITIATHLRELTRTQHVAGTPQGMQTAAYVEKYFQKYGLKAHSVDYKVLLSYPVSRSLSLSTEQLPFLMQDASHQKSMIWPFHAYSPSGTVVGPVVYVNYGREEDYGLLAEMGVNVSGCIAIARYGDVYRGTVVKTAAKFGTIAVIIYSDPQQFGGNGVEGFFPNSKWLSPDGAQYGTVVDGMGDPSTPEWPSTDNSERVSPKFPSIPSMPISAKEAQHILISLSGPTVPPAWRGSLDFCGVGRSQGILNFSYVENQTMTTIRNVFAVIQGFEEPDRFVILGNHRDAWTYGAVDPNSGTAALLEIARNFGAMLQKGWRPRRSIVIGSWDAEEYGMIGSTEWVEQNIGNLGAKAVAYLNVDCAVQGPGFFAGATPQLDDLLIEVTKEVRDPDSKYNTVYESWISRSTITKVKIDRLGGGGSDFVAFLQHAGVSSIDMYFGESYPVYHTIDDCFEWMEKFGDPSFHRHVAVSTIWGLLSLRLVDDRILPFNYISYADELQSYTKRIQEKIDGSKGTTIEPITSAINKFIDVSIRISQEAKILRKPKNEDALSLLRRRAFNDRLMLTERAFLDSQGLKGRPWFKHLVYAPSQNNKYSFDSFPGVLDAMGNKMSLNDQGDKDVQHEIERVARRITEATIALDGNLT